MRLNRQHKARFIDQGFWRVRAFPRCVQRFGLWPLAAFMAVACVMVVPASAGVG